MSVHRTSPRFCPTIPTRQESDHFASPFSWWSLFTCSVLDICNRRHPATTGPNPPLIGYGYALYVLYVLYSIVIHGRTRALHFASTHHLCCGGVAAQGRPRFLSGVVCGLARGSCSDRDFFSCATQLQQCVRRRGRSPRMNIER